MKKSLLFILMLGALPFFAGCSSENDGIADEVPANAQTNDAGVLAEVVFPDRSGRPLSSDPVSALSSLVRKMEPENALKLSTEMYISDAQFAEIKEFVDKNLQGATGEETFLNIFNWTVKNLKYAWYPTPAYLDPYDVFVNKTCVCQGYANLFKTMMVTQNLPAFGVNGQLVGVGAHAWNYAYDGEKWWVADPTNNMKFEMSAVDDYKNRLSPQRADISLFEDEYFYYGFENEKLNVNGVKSAAPADLTIPYSVMDYQITSFFPTSAIPAHVRSLCFGKNIKTFGDYSSQLQDYTPGVEEVYLDPKNASYDCVRGIIYKTNDTTPFYIPTRAKRVELQTVKTMGKNFIYDLGHVEEIVVWEGTTAIESYAIEKCPKLKRVYIPTTVTSMPDDAIYNCGSNVEIIRMPTGIHNVTM